jgi:hypothetical protein
MSDRFRVLGLEDLFALDLPATEWRVDGILPCGACGLLSAREKAGKGLLAMDLLASVAEERPFRDRAVKAGAVAYFPAEESLQLVRERIGARVGGRRDLPFAVIPLNGFVFDPDTPADRLRLDDPVAMLRLYNTIKGEGFDVVVLDTLRELHDRAENESDEMGPLLRPLRELTHELNITLLVSHHMNKANGFRGSTAIRAAFDVEWAFIRTDREGAEMPEGSLTVDGRFGPKQTIHIALGDGMRWTVGNAPDVPPDASLRGRILGWLSKCRRWQTAEEIADTLVDPSYKLKTVQNALAAIAKEQPCPIARAGTGQRNDPRRYHCLSPELLAETLPDDSGKLGNQRGNNQLTIIDSPVSQTLKGNQIRGNSYNGHPVSDAAVDPAFVETVENVLGLSEAEFAALGSELAWYEHKEPDTPNLALDLAAYRHASGLRMNGAAR